MTGLDRALCSRLSSSYTPHTWEFRKGPAGDACAEAERVGDGSYAQGRTMLAVCQRDLVRDSDARAVKARRYV